MRSGGSLLSMMAMLVATMPSARAASCVLAPQGDGRVGEIVDARTFRLDDGNEVQLAGIETIADSARARAALAALIAGRDVTLTGDSDMPDRYGRQPAFVALGSGLSVQAALVAQGMALVAGTVTDRACAEELASAEGAARRARRGVWAQPGVIKNAESPGEVLAGFGRFAVVEGRILSVREAGGVTYINFGRRWTQDFAVTISRRMVAAVEAAGISLKTLERRRIRVRGWVERRGGPRIEVRQAAQLEVVGDPETAGRE